jgi:uncharacterized RDD family membrane protein YckC
MQNHHDYFPNATPGKRFLAFFVDWIFVSICMQLVNSISLKLFHFDSPWLLLFLSSILYYALPQHLTGQSIGKKIFNLKVVAIETDAPASLMNSILRETFGKLISCLILFIGFFAILFRDDRRAWHDQMFKTKVISLTLDTKEMSIWTVVGTSGAILSALLGAGFYLQLYTTQPLEQIAKTLEIQGVHLTGLHGSAMKGYLIDKIEFNEKGQLVELTNMKLKFQNILAGAQGKEFIFQEVSADSLRIQIAQKDSVQIKEKAAPEKMTPAASLNRTIPKISIVHLSFKNIRISDEIRHIQAQVSEFSIENLRITKEKSFVESLIIDANTFQLAVGNFSIDHSSLAYELSLSGLLKPQLDKRIMKNLDFSGALVGQGTKFQNINLAFFENKVRFYSSADHKFIFSMTKFTPRDYLVGAVPFKKITSFATLVTPTALLGNLVLNGNLEINNTNFRISSGPQQNGFVAFANRGDENFSVQMNNVSLNSLLGISPPSKISISSSRASAPQDSLPRFYFGKNLSNLTPPELILLSKESSAFEVPTATVLVDQRLPAARK